MREGPAAQDRRAVVVFHLVVDAMYLRADFLCQYTEVLLHDGPIIGVSQPRLFSHEAVDLSAKLLNDCAGLRVVNQAYEACVPAHTVSKLVFIPHPLLWGIFKLEWCDQHHRPREDFIHRLLGEGVDIRIGVVETTTTNVHHHRRVEIVLKVVRDFRDIRTHEDFGHRCCESRSELLTGRELTC